MRSVVALAIATSARANRRRAWATASALLAAATCGCYASHVRSRADAGVDGGHDSAMEGGTSSSPDAFEIGIDAGCERATTGDTGLPQLIDPVVGDGERPSATARAARWVDPPVSSDVPCCEIGEIVTLDESPMRASAPTLSRARSFYGVAWAEATALFCPTVQYQALDDDGRPLGARRSFGRMGAPVSSTWATDRFAMAESGVDSDEGAGLVLFDASGTIMETRLEPRTFVSSIVRFAPAHAWVAGSSVANPTGPGMTSMVSLDDHLGVTARAQLTDEPRERFDLQASVTVVGSRIVAIAQDETGGFARIFEGAELTALARVGLISRSGQHWAVALRDTVVIVSEGGLMMTEVLDPFEGRLVAGPNATIPSLLWGSAALASDDEGGTVGACWVQSSTVDAEALLRFALLDPHGYPIGPLLSVESPVPIRGECAIASRGRDEYLVTYTSGSHEAGVEARLFAVPIHVRR